MALSNRFIGSKVSPYSQLLKKLPWYDIRFLLSIIIQKFSDLSIHVLFVVLDKILNFKYNQSCVISENHNEKGGIFYVSGK